MFNIRIRRLLTRRIRGTVVCAGVIQRWILGAAVYRWIVGAAVRSGQFVLRLGIGHLGSGVMLGVSQTALNGELQQLVIVQVAVQRIILESQSGCR